MTPGNVRYSDFAVTDGILVCLNLTTRAFTTILLASFVPTFLE